jgi:hypothetical protein
MVCSGLWETLVLTVAEDSEPSSIAKYRRTDPTHENRL